jgi:signal transduction histidine kinase
MKTDGKLSVVVGLELFERRGGEWIRIAYQDNGPGVPAEFKERIWEYFFSRRPGEPSSGIGLPYVKRIVETHGGTIREEGTPREGALFVIELPRFAESMSDQKEQSNVANIGS